MAALLALAALAGWSPGVWAQAEESPIKPVGELSERYLDEAQISGTIVAGVQTLSEGTLDTPRLTAAVPDDWLTMCLHVYSIDGRYTRRQQYEIADEWEGGSETITLDTTHPEAWRGYEPSELALLLQRGECGAVGGEIALAGWDDGPVTDGTIAILVNSFRADEVFVVDRASLNVFACTMLEPGARTAYDSMCKLPLDALAQVGPISLEIRRLRGGNADPPEPVVIARAGQ